MKDIEYTKKKFETFFSAIEELPLKSSYKILHLEKKQKVTTGNKNQNMLRGLFIDYIRETLTNELKKNFEKCNVLCVLENGWAESSIVGKEALYVIHFESCVSSIDKVGIHIHYLDLADFPSADLIGIIDVNQILTFLKKAKIN